MRPAAEAESSPGVGLEALGRSEDSMMQVPRKDSRPVIAEWVAETRAEGPLNPTSVRRVKSPGQELGPVSDGLQVLESRLERGEARKRLRAEQAAVKRSRSEPGKGLSGVAEPGR